MTKTATPATQTKRIEDAAYAMLSAIRSFDPERARRQLDILNAIVPALIGSDLKDGEVAITLQHANHKRETNYVHLNDFCEDDDCRQEQFHLDDDMDPVLDVVRDFLSEAHRRFNS